MSQPAHLSGVTVLDLASVGPAARCTRILADYGATVIKVAPTPRKGALQTQPAYWAYSAGRGMKRVQIDLKAPAGKAAFLRLAAAADVIVESYRPGVVARLGIAYDDVRRVNERIIYCSTSGYGQDGPASQWAGHDLNYLAVGGYLYCGGRRADGGPALPGATVADSAAGGMHAVIAIMAALLRRQTTGSGEYLDVSVADGVLFFTSLYVDEYLATGVKPGPGHDILTGRYAFYDLYQARDGKWLSVGAIESAFYRNLCTALGCEQWIPHQTDDARQEEIRTAFRAAFATRDRDEWVAALAARDTCVAPVYSIEELTGDPQFAHRRVFVEALHERHGRFRQLGPVMAGIDRSPATYTAPDASRTDTADLLRQAGVSAAEIEEMEREGTIA
ncbi:MAG: CaiB/BaiF CoA-transferase family protein [Candidatus Binatia bacterium]